MKTLDDVLYPEIAPLRTGRLQVSPLHSIYWETAGNPKGIPALFLHGAFDYVCETMDSRLAEPMRAHCADLTEAVVESGHWMAQEKPAEVNAALKTWLSTKLPGVWPG